MTPTEAVIEILRCAGIFQSGCTNTLINNEHATECPSCCAAFVGAIAGVLSQTEFAGEQHATDLVQSAGKKHTLPTKLEEHAMDLLKQRIYTQL